MAVDFTPTDYLNIDGTPPITDYPFAITAWVRSDSVTLGQTVLFIGDKDGTFEKYYAAVYLRGDAGDVVRAFVHQHAGVFTASADTANTYTAFTWRHVAGLFLATGIYAYLDGDVGNRGSDTTNIPTVSQWDRMRIGYLGDNTPALPFDGRIAEATLYELTDWGANDAARLAEFERQVPGMAARWHPQFFGPGRTSCWPLGGLDGLHYRDIWGGYDMSATGGPAWADHPGGLVYPSGAVDDWTDGVAAGTTVTPSPLSATWSVPTPTLRKTTSPAPVSVTWSVLSPTLRKIITPSPVSATWSVPSPTLRKTISPSAVSATWSVPAPTLRKTASPAALGLTWAIASPTLRKTTSPAGLGLTWSVPSPTIAGAVTVTPSPVSATWSVPAPTLRKIITPAALGLTWGTPSPTLKEAISVDAVSATWSATAPTLKKAVSPTPLSLSWTAPALTLRKTSRPGALTATWSVPSPTAEGLQIGVPGPEYTVPPGRLHYTAPDGRLHYTAPPGRLHYTAPSED